ncbi:MAG: hypothetical protein AAGJ50_06260 [Pseudomonadota bacterium]
MGNRGKSIIASVLVLSACTSASSGNVSEEQGAPTDTLSQIEAMKNTDGAFPSARTLFPFWYENT